MTEEELNSVVSSDEIERMAAVLLEKYGIERDSFMVPSITMGVRKGFDAYVAAMSAIQEEIFGAIPLLEEEVGETYDLLRLSAASLVTMFLLERHVKKRKEENSVTLRTAVELTKAFVG